MKVELQNGDRLTVPNGCKATINGNEVVIEKGNLEFKDGDVLVSNDKYQKFSFIFKGGEGYYHLDALFTVQHRIYKDCFSDREMVKKYNHFRTKELAKEAAEVVKEALKKFHENE